MVGLIRTQWIVLWISFEINTITICFALTGDSYFHKKINSPSLIYYVVQLITSFIFLWSISKDPTMVLSRLSCIVLFTKMGVWPFHLWYLKLINLLEPYYLRLFLLITWQKLLPIFVVSYLLLEKRIFIISLILVIIGLAFPLWGFSVRLSFKRIIAFSSINNNSWVVLLIFCSFWGIILFFIVYSYSLLKVIHLVKLVNKKTKKLYENHWWSLLIVSNLGGLPPLPLFWVKLIVFKFILEGFLPKRILLFIIVIACFFLYLYLSIRFSRLTEFFSKNNLPFISSKIFLLIIFIVFLFIIIIFKKSEKAHFPLK